MVTGSAGDAKRSVVGDGPRGEPPTTGCRGLRLSVIEVARILPKVSGVPRDRPGAGR